MILVTGGLGYIGSHYVVSGLMGNQEIVVIDNLTNSKLSVKERVEKITNKTFVFEKGDVLDKESLASLFDKYDIDAVIHFAGLKAVGESVEKPLLYYKNNVEGTLNLLEQMEKHKVNKIVFSSSATVYGTPQYLPYDEKHPKAPINPYGRTKSQIEDILEDVCQSNEKFSAISLRYFNPVGAHESGLIGEDPNGIPNNLMPYILKVANKELPHLNIFGDDYDTNDGTGERDYIHVVDLVDGHIKALEYLYINKGYHTFNLGTGNPTSVLEMVKEFESINSIKVPFKIDLRREGDLPAFWANASKAKTDLSWQACNDIAAMMRDSWNAKCILKRDVK